MESDLERVLWPETLLENNLYFRHKLAVSLHHAAFDHHSPLLWKPFLGAFRAKTSDQSVSGSVLPSRLH